MRSSLFLTLFLLAYSSHSQTVRTEYSFSVRSGRAPVTIRVEPVPDGRIGGASVFQGSSTVPLQTITSCRPDLAELPAAGDSTPLVEHADFNFDGFEDLKLLQLHHPHLGRSIFCIYLWDERAAKFRYDPQIPMTDPIPHADSKTITSYNEYLGGTWFDSVYVWSAGKLLLIAEWGLVNEAGSPCGWTAWCSKRMNGKLRSVSTRPTGCNGTEPVPPKCTPPPRSVYAPARKTPK